MKLKWLFTILLVVLCAQFTVDAAEIYISPTGKDANDGTPAAPLATLAAARDKADILKIGNTPVTVYLRGGTYYLDTPVVFGPSNSGSQSAPIIYKAYGSETPVVSGGIKLPDTLSWKVSSGQIMVATISPGLKVDQLFLNGKRQILARYPNFDSTTVILDGYATDCISRSRVARWANPAEGPGYVRALHPNLWGGNSFTITGKVGTDSVTLKWSGDNNNGSDMHATYRMVENIFEELDAPGEWFYRKSTGQLFFYPPPGTNLSASKIELASQDELIRIVGNTTTKVSYLIFNGLTFAHTYRTLFSKPYEAILRSDWHIARTGCIFMENSDNIRVENCLFDQIGGNGVFMSGYNWYNVVYNNTFVDAGASCVNLDGLMSAVRCPFLWSTATACNDRTPGPLTSDYPAYCTVENNTMNHFGRFEKQTAGVDMTIAQCDTVRHNTIHDCPRAAINIGSGCFAGHEVSYNWVYNSVLETSDHGPFNSWGRDRNLDFQSDTSATQLDAVKTTVIHNNRWEVRQGLFGLDLDDQSSNYLLYNNLLLGSGLKVQWSRHNRWINNILAYGANTTITGVWWGSNDYLARNIFTSGQPYWCNFFSPITNPNLIADTISSHIRLLDSNIISAGAGNVSTEAGSVTWANWRAAGLDVHSVAGDPLFTDTTRVFPNYRPRGDFSVRPGSPALALGFANFPMDSFGVMPVSAVATLRPAQYGAVFSKSGPFSVLFRNGRLLVSHEGKYHVTVTTAAGRVVRSFSGQGNSSFEIGPATLGNGMYFATIRSAHGIVAKKILVN
jgi:Right handed beta helix region